MNKAHAFAATAHRRFQHHRITDFVTDAYGLFGALQRLFRTRHYGYAGRNHPLAGGYLVAHGFHGFRRRADEDNAFFLATAGKLRILRQEAVARMNGIRTAMLRHSDYFLYVQITLFGRGRSYRIGFVGVRYMMRSTVGFGKYSHGQYSHFLAGAHHAQGNLTSVRYQYFLYHFLLIYLYKEYFRPPIASDKHDTSNPDRFLSNKRVAPGSAGRTRNGTVIYHCACTRMLHHNADIPFA